MRHGDTVTDGRLLRKVAGTSRVENFAYQFTRRFSAEEALEKLAVEVQAEGLREGGVNACLTKPADPAELPARLERFLEMRERP